MSRLLRACVFTIAALLVAVVLSEVWWLLWKRGWPGPPIRLVSHLRGLGAADDPRSDMTLVAWLVLLVTSFGLARLRGRSVE
jgi:hypothetical protein